MIYFNSLINNIHFGLLYQEGLSLLNLGFLTTKKFKLFNNMFILLSSNNIYQFYYSIFHSSLEFYSFYKRMYSALNSLCYSTQFGYAFGFRVLGKAYKVFCSYNNYVFRIGYNKYVYRVMPFTYAALSKSRKERFWKLTGLSRMRLHDSTKKIQSIRIPSIYRQKGIYCMGDTYINKKSSGSGL